MEPTRRMEPTQRCYGIESRGQPVEMMGLTPMTCNVKVTKNLMVLWWYRKQYRKRSCFRREDHCSWICTLNLGGVCVGASGNIGKGSRIEIHGCRLENRVAWYRFGSPLFWGDDWKHEIEAACQGREGRRKGKEAKDNSLGNTWIRVWEDDQVPEEQEN